MVPKSPRKTENRIIFNPIIWSSFATFKNKIHRLVFPPYWAFKTHFQAYYAVVNFFTARILTRGANSVPWKMSSLSTGRVELDGMCPVRQQELRTPAPVRNECPTEISPPLFPTQAICCWFTQHQKKFIHVSLCYCKPLLNVKVRFKAAHTTIPRKKQTPQSLCWVLANTDGLVRRQGQKEQGTVKPQLCLFRGFL